MLLADELTVFRGDHRKAYDIYVPAFHSIKTLAHLAVARLAEDDTPRSDEPRSAHVREHIRRARVAIATNHDIDRDAASDIERVFDLLERETIEARALGDGLLRLTFHATRAQLGRLDARAKEALQTLTSDEREKLHVVVAGDHQARDRSLGMQYFRKLLREEPGKEERVVYAEGVTDAKAALLLVGTRRIDRKIALELFGDPRRLQRDILGDATEELLATLPMGT